mmetsp:Transcript_33808/g.100852  ORF Transcript_33808/g.100852 Transcript_33808/m.100852 type:complete len:185 (-) Transcript_33808:374-928(-)|eukprot:CAMPEP_0113544810 /NCGR_PEP_ID=MMETSP0015_2-20120614/10909_1 /TAXON_ID=2838 /ORGANISM="Odontella" /LENGTH=184 /DNA_ID=CAMNT_0000445099 /DNA_START=202 /DNA_END=756 /DNA_ORIENTATION=+ /assembly_acc=CAM_ASM_000160
MVKSAIFLLAGMTSGLAAAFAPAASLSSRPTFAAAPLRMSTAPGEAEVGPIADEPTDMAAAGRNPDRPELPEIKGDYNWDDAFAGDPDWITENVPGKVVLDEVRLAAQVTALSKLEDQWRKERLQVEYDDARILGWTGMAETYNSRFAMFFLVVGLLTEYWTGVTIPGQIEEMLRVGGFIGPDY